MDAPARMRPTAGVVKGCVEIIRVRTRLARVEAALTNIESSAPADFDLPRGGGVEADTAGDLWDIANGEHCVCQVIPESAILKPPKGTAWARVRTNFSLPEDYKQEFYVPYLGEEDEDMDKSSSLAKEIMDEDNRKAEEKEKAGEWFQKTPYSNVLGKDIREQADDSDAENELLDHSKDRTKESYARGAWDRAFKRLTILSVISAFGANKDTFYDCVTLLSKELDIMEEHVCRYFSNACYRAWKWAQSDAHDDIMRKHREDLRNWIRNEKRTDTKSILESNSVGFFYCRRCNIHDCDLHGCGVDLTPIVTPFDATRKECLEENKRREIEQACEFAGTINCHAFLERQKRLGNGSMVFGNGFISVDVQTNGIPNGINHNYYGKHQMHRTNIPRAAFRPNEVIDLCSSSDDDETVSRAPPPPPPLPPLPKSAPQSIFRNDEGAALLLELFRTVLGNDYCRLASVINLTQAYYVTCSQVGSYLSQVKGERLSREVVRAPPLMKPPKHSKSKQMRLISVQENQVLMKGKRLDYTPCNHDGPCTKENCSCARKGLFCEKYCRCCSPRVNGNRTHVGNWCRNIFPFCKCKPGHCKTESCDCVVAKRECDPDHCGCHCSFEKKTSSGELKKCHNVNLRNNEITRIVCGYSSVHGWGAYACAPIKKGALIGQYTGEIISEGDGERRGRVYDQKNLSFLFNITPDWVVDSTRLGNKLRHLNHSRNFNCEAKILRVDGDVLVGLFAAKDIQAWEELLFNYGYGETGPEFARCNNNTKRTKLDSAAMKTSRRRDSEKGNVKNVALEISSDDDSEYDGDKEDDEDDEDFRPGM